MNNLAIIRLVARPEGVYLALGFSGLVCLPSAETPRKAAAVRPFVANHFGPAQRELSEADHTAIGGLHGD